jgi:UDP-2,3-diacylglucosamine hydrolase
MEVPLNKKIYFLSDFHLGAPNAAESLVREKKIIQFLNEIKQDAAQIFIVGDLFDFWYEYRKVVPRGFVRILGKLAELTDAGIPIHFFVGNHDMWMKDYFQKEMNILVYFEPAVFEFNGKKFLVGHGDGLGPGDHGYKFIKKIFRNPICQWLFRWLHPDIGVAMANFFSKTSRASQDTHKPFLGEDKEWLIIYANEKLKKCPHIDYFIFGHRHLAQDLVLRDGKSRYINLGHWFGEGNYAFFDGAELLLKKFE